MKGTHNILITQNNINILDKKLFVFILYIVMCFKLFQEVKQINYNIPPCDLLKSPLIIFTNLKGIVLGLLSYILFEYICSNYYYFHRYYKSMSKYTCTITGICHITSI